MFFDRGCSCCGAGIGLAAVFATIAAYASLAFMAIGALVLGTLAILAACYVVVGFWVGLGYGVYLFLGGDDWLAYRRKIIRSLPLWKRQIASLVWWVISRTAILCATGVSIVAVLSGAALIFPWFGQPG
jgi:hypothetical protein